ncbi:MAG: ethanolamine ammonia-lyase subunit EutC [Syntrophobacteraceae bacterium]
MMDFEGVVGDVSRNKPVFHDNNVAWALKERTGARIGVGRSGARPLTSEVLKFRVDHAAARDAIYDSVPEDVLKRHECVGVETLAADKGEYLLRPDLGRRIREEGLETLRREFPQGETVLILIGDGLSASAVEANLDDILPSLRTGLERHGYTAPRPIFIKNARVGVMDHVGEALSPETAVLLIGERPGLISSESMSAYMCYKPRFGKTDSDRNVISNIHRGGVPPLEAGAVIADFIHRFLELKTSGVNVKGA